jgi:hypothetical protein
MGGVCAFSQAGAEPGRCLQSDPDVAGDAEAVPFLRASRSALHFELNFPEIVDDNGMKTLLHEATPEVTEMRQKFGLRKTKPLLVLDALIPILTKLRDFQQQADGDTTLSANQVIMKLIRIRNKKQIKLFTTQCKINHKKTYVMRLRYYAQNKEWQAFRELAAKSKCSKLKRLCVELLHLHGGEHEMKEFADAVDLKLAMSQEKYGPEELAQKSSYFHWFKSCRL